MIPIYRTEVKSDEEWHMVLWCQEATGHGLVSDWQYEPQSFELFPAAKYNETKQLKTKTKVVERCLHRGTFYTPDFKIVLTSKGRTLLFNQFKECILTNEGGEVFIDVKGNFNPHQKDPRYFVAMQKATHFIHGVWTQKIVPFYMKGKGANRKPKGFFFDTFAPADAMRSPVKKEINNCGKHCKTITEFIKDDNGTFSFNDGLALDLRNGSEGE